MLPSMTSLCAIHPMGKRGRCCVSVCTSYSWYYCLLDWSCNRYPRLSPPPRLSCRQQCSRTASLSTRCASFSVIIAYHVYRPTQLRCTLRTHGERTSRRPDTIGHRTQSMVPLLADRHEGWEYRSTKPFIMRNLTTLQCSHTSTRFRPCLHACHSRADVGSTYGVRRH